MEVLTVAEAFEHVVDGGRLALESDEVDVAVVTLGKLEVDGVVMHGEAAGEAKDDAALVPRVDDAPRLGHHLLVACEGRVERGVVQARGRLGFHVHQILPRS